jgi:glycosyltransferase involved in cell wall biosynthesis
MPAEPEEFLDKQTATGMIDSDSSIAFSQNENSEFAIRSTCGDPSGLTVVILSYERLRALAALLKSLLRQDLHGLGLEVIVCNNSSRVHLRKNVFSRIGRRLSRFPDLKIFNSSFDWHTQARYGLGTMARYDVVLFLDDDIILRDKDFLWYMFETYAKLGPTDMLGCWCDIWLDWSGKTIKGVALSFLNQSLTEVTKVDFCGMGICMFHKRLLFHPIVANMSMGDERVRDYLFPVLVNMQLGTQAYFLPSYKKLKFHRQNSKGAICAKTGFYKAANTLLKTLIDQGYKPLLVREPELFNNSSSPEAKAVRIAPRTELPWT